MHGIKVEALGKLSWGNAGVSQSHLAKFYIHVRASQLAEVVKHPPPWSSPGKNTGVGSHSLLQKTFPT